MNNDGGGDDDAMMTDATTAAVAVGGDPLVLNNVGGGAEANHDDVDEIADDTPAFIDMQDAVEVQVDDDNRPTDDGDDDDNDANGDQGAVGTATGDDDMMNIDDAAGAATMTTTAPADDSKYQLTSHTDSVYSVAAAIDVQTGQLNVMSGGGDDKSFLHGIPTTTTAPPTTNTTIQIPYPFQDTVSSIVYNWKYVSDPTDSKTPRLVAVGSYDGTILLYDTTQQQQQSQPLQPKLQLEGPSDVEWMAFHPKGGTVLLVGSGDASVWMYHLPLNRCLQVFVGHQQAVTCGDFTPDGKWALSASTDGTLRIWAPKTGMSKHVFKFHPQSNSHDSSIPPAGLTCMATGGGTDAMLVMVGAENGEAHVCHVGTKKVVATLKHFELNDSTRNGPNNNDGDDNEDEIEYPMSVEAVGFSPTQPTWCATGGVDGKLKIWDLSRDGGQLRQVCQLDTPTTMNDTTSDGAAADSITRLRWHPTLPLVFTAHISGQVALWDARSGALLRTLHGGQEQINDMDVQYAPSSPNLAFIVTASDDKTVRVFDLDVNAALQTSVATTS